MSAFFENYLKETTPEVMFTIPEHWRVIYHQAMASHHILFDESDIKGFKRIKMTTFKPSEAELEQIDNIVLSLYQSPDIPAMRNKIASLSLNLKELVFYFYLRSLKAWRKNLASSLN